MDTHIALADAFIQDSITNGSQPFRIAWFKSDTTVSIQYLKSGIVDVGITYSPAAEQFAISQGIARSPSYYAFRDHFIVVGPPSNPANVTNLSDVLTLFATLYEAAEAATSNPPVRFLSRYDKSATNIKESLLWAGIGQVRGARHPSFPILILFAVVVLLMMDNAFSEQVPWATAYSTWYHQYIAFPIQALTAAILLNEYTLTDKGTFLSLPANLTDQTVIYKAATDSADDPLLNPAHLLIGRKAPNADMAKAFATWVVSRRGQDVIAGFKKNGQQLYSPAP